MRAALTAALLAVASGLLAFTLLWRLFPLRALRREHRLDQPLTRLAGMLRHGFGQPRMLAPGERGPGLTHLVIRRRGAPTAS